MNGHRPRFRVPPPRAGEILVSNWTFVGPAVYNGDRDMDLYISGTGVLGYLERTGPDAPNPRIHDHGPITSFWRDYHSHSYREWHTRVAEYLQAGRPA